MRLPTLSIRASVLLAIVAGMVLPALVVLALDIHFTRESREPELQRNRAGVMALATALVSEPAWTLSERGLQAAVRRIASEPSVCTVEVLDLSPVQKFQALRGGACPSNVAVATLEAPVEYGGQIVARLRIAFDDEGLGKVLADRRDIALRLVLVQVVFGVLILTGLLSVRLLHPIDRLKAQAGRLAAHDPMPPGEWRRRDELGQLGQHLNEVHQRIRDLISELEGKNAQLHRMAMYDDLTGLPNRTLVRELFSRAAATARRHQHQLALLFIDLDHFKTVNDTHGHAVGDHLLLGVSRRLTNALRESDIVCRMGGDEFFVLLAAPESIEHVAVTATRLLEAIAMPLTLEGAIGTVRISASMGIALYPQDGADFNALARTADLAMYHSKEQGRGRHSFFHAELDAALRKRTEVEQELAQALDENQMVLHYQPVVDAATRRLVGCEALLRILHPQRGLLSPNAFIAVAESTGQIRPLGLWTLEAACADLAQWKRASLHPGYMAVNVSAVQLRDEHLGDAVRETMRRHGLVPGDLELELTESMLLSGIGIDGDMDADGVATMGGARALPRVGRLREAGASLVVDDFGTGYSSLSYLKLIRPDKVKIDRSFVRDLPHDGDDRALVRAIIGIAQALSITVVAEGVETPAQSSMLIEHGCSLQQGFLHARPMPAAAYLEWMARYRAGEAPGADAAVSPAPA